MKVNEILCEDTDESKLRFKAGVVPYVIQNGIIKMLFMVPSDAAYGGTQPCISKGGSDPGETPQQTAVREGEEELGLPASIYTQVYPSAKARIAGMTSSYDFYVFAGQMKSMPSKIPFGHEVGAVHWLTMEEYQKYGRKNQLALVQQTYDSIKAKHANQKK
jgi:8-oxo-dGTP pyrophosphatase MutT (NUDIX family)